MKKVAKSSSDQPGINLSRRNFLKGVLGSTLTLAMSSCLTQADTSTPQIGKTLSVNRMVDEFGVPATPYDAITTYNNFYEYATDKRSVARLATEVIRSPWEISVGGLVRNPGVFDVDILRKKFTLEERIYRMRCVEGWSMIIPWQGFPLHKWIESLEPTSDARFVRFESIYEPDKLIGQKDKSFPWPYIEGLTIEEAMHPLTLIGTGIYGKDLLPQNGAPIRLVLPWKYGFKSIKSIVKIEFVDTMPVSFWMKAGPTEYGFYANVNPEVPHRRWSQATEVLVTESIPRPTRKFNGYDQVASLYQNQDQNIWY